MQICMQLTNLQQTTEILFKYELLRVFAVMYIMYVDLFTSAYKIEKK